MKKNEQMEEIVKIAESMGISHEEMVEFFVDNNTPSIRTYTGLVDEVGSDGVRRILGSIGAVTELLAEEYVKKNVAFQDFNFCLAECYEKFSTLESLGFLQNGIYGAKEVNVFDSDDIHVLFSYYGNSAITAISLWDGLDEEDANFEFKKGFLGTLSNEVTPKDYETVIFLNFPTNIVPDYQKLADAANRAAGSTKRTAEWAEDVCAAFEIFAKQNGGKGVPPIETLLTPFGFSEEYEAHWYTYESIEELVDSEVEQCYESFDTVEEERRYVYGEVIRMAASNKHQSVFVGKKYVLQVCN